MSMETIRIIKEELDVGLLTAKRIRESLIKTLIESERCRLINELFIHHNITFAKASIKADIFLREKYNEK